MLRMTLTHKLNRRPHPQRETELANRYTRRGESLTAKEERVVRSLLVELRAGAVLALAIVTALASALLLLVIIVSHFGSCRG